MGIPPHAGTTETRFVLWPALGLRAHTTQTLDISHVELQASLARERALQAKNGELIRQAEEFEHRLINSAQVIVSLLSSQSRSASPEAAAQLTVAINRIIALGHVHRRLHRLDRRKTVELRQFLQQLCTDLSGMFFTDPVAQAIEVQGEELEIPTELGSPLGFIVSELVTNSARHGNGTVKVRLQSTSPEFHALSLSDDGPGLPEGFEPDNCKGLGMKIVLALVKQIGGELHCSSGESGSGARFVVTFRSQGLPARTSQIDGMKTPISAGPHSATQC